MASLSLEIKRKRAGAKSWLALEHLNLIIYFYCCIFPFFIPDYWILYQCFLKKKILWLNIIAYLTHPSSISGWILPLTFRVSFSQSLFPYLKLTFFLFTIHFLSTKRIVRGPLTSECNITLPHTHTRTIGKHTEQWKKYSNICKLLTSFSIEKPVKN